MEIKLFLAMLTIFSLLMLTPAQQIRSPSRSKANKAPTSIKQPPIIKSFKSSSSIAVIPCPPDLPPNTLCQANGITPKLTTEAFDRTGDALLYQYTVSGGHILGDGANVVWDLTGTPPGSYRAKVVVKNRRGGRASSSLQVNVIDCPNCGLRPCATVAVSCPDIAEEGRFTIFTVKVSGAERGIKSTYQWSVSAGTITKGQGTDEIEVDTNGLGGQQLMTTIKVGGHPPECQTEASCKVQIRKKSAK